MILTHSFDIVKNNDAEILNFKDLNMSAHILMSIKSCYKSSLNIFSICLASRYLLFAISFILFDNYSGTPVFPSGLANLRQNPGVGSISLMSTDFQTSPKKCWTVYWTGSRNRSESASINSTVRSYLYPVSRTPTDDPIYGEGMGKVRVYKLENRY